MDVIERLMTSAADVSAEAMATNNAGQLPVSLMYQPFLICKSGDEMHYLHVKPFTTTPMTEILSYFASALCTYQSFCH